MEAVVDHMLLVTIHLEVLLVDNDVKDVIKNKSFDYPTNNKDK